MLDIQELLVASKYQNYLDISETYQRLEEDVIKDKIVTDTNTLY